MRRFPGKIIDVVEESGLNPNQISKASGVSNAYLAKLIHGEINRPGKDKVASIMLALNHTMSEINELLADYDYQPLHADDIPAILENNRRRKIEGGNLPQYDHIYFDLLLVALEQIGGTRIVVKDRPSGIFMPRELYLMKEYPYESDDDAARFRRQLTGALLAERMRQFQEQLAAGTRLETYICRRCLEEYLDRNIGPAARAEHPKRAALVTRYMANALSLALKRPEQHLIRIMRRCPYFHFLMQDADGEQPKVSYPGRKPHFYDTPHDQRMLEGFTTDLPQVVGHFKQEVEMCRAAVEESLVEGYPGSIEEYLAGLFEERGMGEEFRLAVGELMGREEVAFF
ncbi:MAG: hypothetical protein ACLFRG_21475 [Desulfococcaceae bacterium]